MKTKLSKDFLHKEQRHNLLKQTIKILFCTFVFIASLFYIINFFHFVSNGNSVNYENNFIGHLLDISVKCCGVIYLIIMTILGGKNVFSLFIEFGEIVQTIFFICQIKKNNYTIRMCGQWYEVYCKDCWLGTYRMTEYEP